MEPTQSELRRQRLRLVHGNTDTDSDNSAESSFHAIAFLNVELRNLAGDTIAKIEITSDATMGQIFAKLQAQGIGEDYLRTLRERGKLVLLKSGGPASEEVQMWPMHAMYVKPTLAPSAKAEIRAHRPIIFQIVMSSIRILPSARHRAAPSGAP